MKTVRLLSALLVVILLSSARVAVGQVTASLSGRVEDSSGAAITGATVSATSEETGATRSVQTDNNGQYRILSLPVGRYDLKAESPGFKTKLQEGVDLVVGQQAVVNLALEVGQVQQEITVTGEAPLVKRALLLLKVSLEKQR